MKMKMKIHPLLWWMVFPKSDTPTRVYSKTQIDQIHFSLSQNTFLKTKKPSRNPKSLYTHSVTIPTL